MYRPEELHRHDSEPGGELEENGCILEEEKEKKGDHRPRNSAQYERVVELLIMHKAKRTPRRISLLPSVS